MHIMDDFITIRHVLHNSNYYIFYCCYCYLWKIAIRYFYFNTSRQLISLLIYTYWCTNAFYYISKIWGDLFYRFAYRNFNTLLFDVFLYRLFYILPWWIFLYILELLSGYDLIPARDGMLFAYRLNRYRRRALRSADDELLTSITHFILINGWWIRFSLHTFVKDAFECAWGYKLKQRERHYAGAHKVYKCD